MTRDELRALADHIDSAAETINEINARDHNGIHMSWNAIHLTDYAHNLRIEADEIDDEPWVEDDCIHCSGTEYSHDRTCRHGADE